MRRVSSVAFSLGTGYICFQHRWAALPGCALVLQPDRRSGYLWDIKRADPMDVVMRMPALGAIDDMGWVKVLMAGRLYR